MLDFKIRRGLYSTIFPEPGVINSKLVIEEGCWYLCTDTAELFLGVLLDSGKLTLKRINGNNATNLPATGPVGGELEEIVPLFIRISDESELPTDFSLPDFNPNVTYYKPILNSDGQLTGKTITYIYDNDSSSYLCTSSIDDLATDSIVSEAVTILTSQLQGVVKQTIEDTVLDGGNAMQHLKRLK